MYGRFKQKSTLTYVQINSMSFFPTGPLKKIKSVYGCNIYSKRPQFDKKGNKL